MSYLLDDKMDDNPTPPIVPPLPIVPLRTKKNKKQGDGPNKYGKWTKLKPSDVATGSKSKVEDTSDTKTVVSATNEAEGEAIKISHPHIIVSCPIILKSVLTVLLYLFYADM